jgi:hypothetical protein
MLAGSTCQPQDRPVEVSEAFYASLHEQYASMYLEALGVHPTSANMQVNELTPCC